MGTKKGPEDVHVAQGCLWFPGMAVGLESSWAQAYASVLPRYAGEPGCGFWNRFTASECLSFVPLQRQLGKNIKFGQRPSNAIPMKKAGSGEASSEEDLFLTSPMEIVAQQDIILSDAENKVSLCQGMT